MLAEPDERFVLGMVLSRSEDFVVVEVRSTMTSEVHLIDAHRPTESPRLVGRAARVSSTQSTTMRPATSW